jgi:outer membrane protein assembly factor BamE (lipoprotein component of BamABCDE complex)
MKRKLLLSVAFCIILLSSCTTMVRVATTTHKQVMDSYKTKEQVIGKFGIPTSKRVDGDYEELYYLFGVKTVTDRNASLKALFGSSKTNYLTSTDKSGNANANAAAQTVSQEVKTYVKFTLKGNNVVTWESNGVDYGIYIMKKK